MSHGIRRQSAQIRVFPDPEQLSQAAANQFVQLFLS